MKSRLNSLFFILVFLTTLSGCMSVKSFVDPMLPAARAEQVQAVASPQPIQLLYEFRTRGVPNAKATEFTSMRVTEVIKQSRIFSEVSSAPVANQRRLIVTVNNVPITSEGDAKAKGFGTGLTFGLVGSMVTDGYECEATFTATGIEAVKFNFKHALHTTIGNASGPPGLVGSSQKEAMNQLLEQLTWSIMRDLSKSGRL
jgi:hypothetical protein